MASQAGLGVGLSAPAGTRAHVASLLDRKRELLAPHYVCEPLLAMELDAGRVILSMQGILIALDAPRSAPQPFEDVPAPMVPLVDRPCIQHAIERMVDAGIKTIHVIVGARPRPVAEFLGDGQRWGCTIRTHLASDPTQPYQVISRILDLDDPGPTLLGHTARLPGGTLLRSKGGRMNPVYVVAGRAGVASWSGWAWIEWSDIGHLRSSAGGFAELAAHFEGCKERQLLLDRGLNCHNPAGLLAAHARVLGGEGPALIHAGREREPGVWRSSGVRVHPSATLLPPVFLGADVFVGAHARLGPNATVGMGCILDDGVIIRDSVVWAGSYVGPGLTLDKAFLRGSELHHIVSGSTLSFAGQGLFEDTAHRPLDSRGRPGAVERVVAALLLGLSLPFFVAMGIWMRLIHGDPVIHKRQVRASQPQPQPQREYFTQISFAAWEVQLSGLAHLLLRVLPGLIHVVQGSISLIGVEPRTPRGRRSLSAASLEALGPAKVGLIYERVACGSCGGDEVEHLVSDLHYLAQPPRVRDRGVLHRYVRTLLTRGRFGIAAGQGENLSSELVEGA